MQYYMNKYPSKRLIPVTKSLLKTTVLSLLAEVVGPADWGVAVVGGVVDSGVVELCKTVAEITCDVEEATEVEGVSEPEKLVCYISK